MPIMTTELFDALQAGNINLITDDNKHHRTSDGNTPMHILISQGHIAQALTIMKDFGANPYVFNDQRLCALELALRENAKEAVKAMLHRGPTVPLDWIERLVNDAVHRLQDASTPEAKTQIAYALAGRLCGEDMVALLTQNESQWRTAYLAHLQEFKGTAHPHLASDTERYSIGEHRGEAKGTPLEGFFQKKLLPLRLLSWLRILLDLKAGVLREADMPVIRAADLTALGVVESKGTEVPQDRQLSIEEVALHMGRLIEQALTSYLILRMGQLVSRKADKVEYLTALAVGVSQMIKALPDEHSVIIPLTWGGIDKGESWSHAIYLSIAKRGGAWQMWMNNRGHGYNANRTHRFTGVPGRGNAEVYPAGVALITESTCWDENGSGRQYIQGVLMQALTVANPLYPIAQQVYYDLGAGKVLHPNAAAGIAPLNLRTWLPMNEQVVGNCALANQDAALFYGLPPAIANALLMWIRDHEARHSSSDAILPEVPEVPREHYADASTQSHYERLNIRANEQWPGTAEELRDYLFSILIEKHAQYRTSHTLTEEPTLRDYYVSLTLTRVDRAGAGDVAVPCKEDEILQEGVQVAYVTGDSGTGKSTLCREMARRWAIAKRAADGSGLWSEYEWVLVVPLHQLQKKAEALTLRGQEFDKADLWEVAFADARVTATLLRSEAFQLLEGRELCVFDGLDECNLKGSFGEQLKRQLTAMSCMVTSRPRPWPFPQPEGINVQAKVTLEGFSEDQRDQYVRDYLQERSAEFAGLLMRYPELKPLAQVPVLLEMLCYLIRSNSPNAPLSEAGFSMTDLYQKIFSHKALERRFLYKEPLVAEEKVRAAIPMRRKFVATCAVLSWQAGRRVLLPEDIASAFAAQRAQLGGDLETLLHSLGIWRAVTHETDLTQRQWEFAHRSVQEYFVACDYAERLSKGYDSTLIEQMVAQLRQDATSLVLPLVVGLLTRAPYKNELVAKQVCSAIRTRSNFISESPYKAQHSRRLLEDRLWFKCITEIPMKVLTGWNKYDLLSWSFMDFSADRRLKSTLESARLLQCRQFEFWAITEHGMSAIPALTEGELFNLV